MSTSCFFFSVKAFHSLAVKWSSSVQAAEMFSVPISSKCSISLMMGCAFCEARL